MVAWLVADLPLDHVAAVAKEPAVEARSVRDFGLGRAAIAQRPVFGMKFVDPSPGVTARVGGIVASAVIHGAPTHELGSWVVRIAVVVEEVRDGESSCIDGVTSHGPS